MFVIKARPSCGIVIKRNLNVSKAYKSTLDVIVSMAEHAEDSPEIALNVLL